MLPNIFKGIKVLEVNDESFIGAEGYKIYRYSFDSCKKEYIGKVVDKYSFFSRFKLSRRLLRAEINNLYTLPTGERLIIAKKGIFKQRKGNSEFTKVFDVKRGTRPLNLCLTPDGAVYFGEYFANLKKDSVSIYCSKDNGETWAVAYTFAAGKINHIHGLFWDTYTESLWFATGDRENECIIGYTRDGFKNVVEVFRGDQEFRATVLLFYKDYILFGTDSQYIQNQIKRINRKTLDIEPIVNIQGSAIKGGQYRNFSYISTTVEPSKVNLDRYSHLWVSQDGLNWKEIFADKKDCLPSIFQFGSIEFPRYINHQKNNFIFSGRALKNTDGNSVLLEL